MGLIKNIMDKFNGKKATEVVENEKTRKSERVSAATTYRNNMKMDPSTLGGYDMSKEDLIKKNKELDRDLEEVIQKPYELSKQMRNLSGEKRGRGIAAEQAEMLEMKAMEAYGITKKDYKLLKDAEELVNSAKEDTDNKRLEQAKKQLYDFFMNNGAVINTREGNIVQKKYYELLLKIQKIEKNKMLKEPEMNRQKYEEQHYGTPNDDGR